MDDSNNAVDHATVAADLDTSGPAAVEPTGHFSPSGAPYERVPDVEPSHPAVDANPRARTTVAMNAIDFNDPTISGAEAVKRSLDAQAKA